MRIAAWGDNLGTLVSYRSAQGLPQFFYHCPWNDNAMSEIKNWENTQNDGETNGSQEEIQFRDSADASNVIEKG